MGRNRTGFAVATKEVTVNTSAGMFKLFLREF